MKTTIAAVVAALGFGIGFADGIAEANFSTVFGPLGTMIAGEAKPAGLADPICLLDPADRAPVTLAELARLDLVL